MVSPYDVLLIDQDADEEEIERAYRERVKQAHPDQGGSSEEFQLVKAAYQEIKSGTGRQAGTNGQKHKSANSQRGFTCSKCGKSIRNASNATYHQSTEDVFCPDCVVDTNCRICGQELTLTLDQFSEIDGNPVCPPCSQKSRNSTEETTKSDNTSTTGSSSNKLSFLGYFIGGAVIVAIFWYYRPTFVISVEPETMQTLREIVPILLSPWFFILLWWIFRD